MEFENGANMRINANDRSHQASILKRLLTPDDGNEGFRGLKIVCSFVLIVRIDRNLK